MPTLFDSLGTDGERFEFIKSIIKYNKGSDKQVSKFVMKLKQRASADALALALAQVTDAYEDAGYLGHCDGGMS